MATPVEPGTGKGAFAVTKSDTTVFVRKVAALFVGGAGDVAVKMESGETVTFSAVLAGTIMPISVTQVLSTGTNATSIVAITY